jgi:hypothetical protein
MKNKLSFLLVLLTSAYSFGQKDFKWDVKSDSIPNETKDQLYSKTKLFIAQGWKSAQHVIQNDDKESGNVLVKGTITENNYININLHTYTFSYTIKFFVKDNRCRIVIDNVYCTSAGIPGTIHSDDWPCPPVADNYPLEKGWKLTGMSDADKYLQLMADLKNELQLIINSYLEYMKKPAENSDW